MLPVRSSDSKNRQRYATTRPLASTLYTYANLNKNGD